MARVLQSVWGWTSLAAILFTGFLCFGQRPHTLWNSPLTSPDQAADVLQVVCPGNGQPATAGKPLSFPGCRPCPPYTTDGRLDPSTREKFQLRSLIEGSFTAPGAHEAVASFEGCEPHTDEFGGSILLEASGQSWSMVRYIPALITTACRRYRLQTGRDLLLCQERDGHPDQTSFWIAVYDLSRQKPFPSQDVFGIVNTVGACGHTAVWGSLDNAALSDLNSDGMPDLTLSITVGQGTYSDKDGACSPTSSQQQEQKYKLSFLFQPTVENFLPAPSIAATVERLNTFYKDGAEKAYRTEIKRMSERRQHNYIQPKL